MNFKRTHNLPLPVPVLDCLQHVPEHGVFGEEHGLKFGSGGGSPYMWVLDPIDGTKSFITGECGRWLSWVGQSAAFHHGCLGAAFHWWQCCITGVFGCWTP